MRAMIRGKLLGKTAEGVDVQDRGRPDVMREDGRGRHGRWLADGSSGRCSRAAPNSAREP